MNLLTIELYKNEIKDFLLKHYPFVVFKDYYNYYLFFLEELIFRTSNNYTDYNRVIKKVVISNKSLYQKKYLIQDLHFTLPSVKIRKQFSRTIPTKYITNRYTYSPKQRKVAVVDIIKQDLIDMKILILEHNVQLIKTKHQAFYTKSIYSLNLNRPISLFENEEMKFEITGDYTPHSTSDFVFDDKELMKLIESVPLRKFIRNYRIMMKLNNEGYKVKTIGVADRKYHSLSYLSKEFRAIIKVRETNNSVTSKDLKSSFPFFLSILTKNEQLYDDIVTGEIKNLFDKIELLKWFNDKKYKAKKYTELRERFTERYGIDTSEFRDKKGCMFSLLGQMESDYINKIGAQLSYKYFTIHDEFYIDTDGIDELEKAIEVANRSMFFKPIWS